MANSLVMPYLGMPIFIGLLGFAVKKSSQPEFLNEDDSEEANSKGHIKEALSHPS